MADIGSLVVKLAAETSEFQADLGRSARVLDKHASEMKASLQQVASVAKTAFAVVIGAASVAALRDFVTHTLEASAALQGLSEQTGASAAALSGFARNQLTLSLARMGVGIGEATAGPTAYSLISDYFPKRQRATALAIYSAGLYVGGGISLGIGGLIARRRKAAR